MRHNLQYIILNTLQSNNILYRYKDYFYSASNYNFYRILLREILQYFDFLLIYRVANVLKNLASRHNCIFFDRDSNCYFSNVDLTIRIQ